MTRQERAAYNRYVRSIGFDTPSVLRQQLTLNERRWNIQRLRSCGASKTAEAFQAETDQLICEGKLSEAEPDKLTPEREAQQAAREKQKNEPIKSKHVALGLSS